VRFYSFIPFNTGSKDHKQQEKVVITDHM